MSPGAILLEAKPAVFSHATNNLSIHQIVISISFLRIDRIEQPFLQLRARFSPHIFLVGTDIVSAPFVSSLPCFDCIDFKMSMIVMGANFGMELTPCPSNTARMPELFFVLTGLC